MIYGPDGKPASAAGGIDDPDRMTEITRSFSLKLNLQNYGGNQYESADLFCAQKTMCRMDEKSDASMALYQFCKGEILKARREYIENMHRKIEATRAGRAA